MVNTAADLKQTKQTMEIDIDVFIPQVENHTGKKNSKGGHSKTCKLHKQFQPNANKFFACDLNKRL